MLTFKMKIRVKDHPQITFHFTNSDIIDCNAVLILHQMIANDYKEANDLGWFYRALFRL
jgi:hypothetical protein